MLGPSPYFILSGGNQPSSHLVLLDHRRRTRDYVMFVQRPDLSKTAPLSRTTSEPRHAGRMQLLGAPVDRPKQAWFGRVPVDRLPLGRHGKRRDQFARPTRLRQPQRQESGSFVPDRPHTHLAPPPSNQTTLA